MDQLIDFKIDIAPALASRKRRIAAFLIDHVVMTFLMTSLVFLTIGPGYIDEGHGNSQLTFFIAGILGFLLYFAKDSWKGKSVGRWILGIMVRDATNTNDTPSVGRLMVRNLLLIIWPLEFIILALSKEKKRLGDQTAKTVVVKDPDKPGKLPRVIAFIAIGAILFAVSYLFVASAMKNSEAYQIAIQEIERNPEILAETGGVAGYGMMPGGSINITNGRGEAQLQITVLGNKSDVEVAAYLTKEPEGKWEIKKIGM